MGATHKIVFAPLLYKKVMQLTMLDSTATNATLCKNICKLTQYSITCGDVREIIPCIDINYPQLKVHEVMANTVEHILEAFSNGVEDMTSRCISRGRRMIIGMRWRK